MKNCLIVLVALVGCFFVALYLTFYVNDSRMNGSRPNPIIATWRTYGIEPQFQVDVGMDRMYVDELVNGPAKRQEIRGHWTAHAFYVDSHLDAPAQVVVANELKNEDLEVNLGYFKPGMPDKVTFVMMFRTYPQDDDPFPFTGEVNPVTYPPPRGLIRVGMLQCDLDLLPWHADQVELTAIEVNVPYEDHLSDGTVNIAPHSYQDKNDPDPAAYYTYHSDRPGLPKLRVTVYHGRVVEVVGGAEESSDIPYRLEARKRPDNTDTDAPEKPRTWTEWAFNLFFAK